MNSIEGMVFQRRAVQPMVCLREGWRLIKDDYWLFLGITFVGVFVGSLAPLGLLLGPALCGIHLCLLRREKGMPVSFDMLFRGFDYFAQSLVAMLIMIVPILLVSLLLGVGLGVAVVALFAQQPPNAPPNEAFFMTLIAIGGTFYVVILLLSIVVGALFMFTFPLIVDRELSGVDAVKMSLRAARGNFGGVLGLTLLIVLLSLLGVLLCYVGAFLVMPLGYAMIAVAYRQVFPPRLTLAQSLDDEPPLFGTPLPPTSTSIQ